MNRVVSWLAILYVALLPIGRSGLPLNAQWGDLLFPVLLIAAWRGGQTEWWWSRSDWPLAFYLGVTLAASARSPDPLTGLAQLAKQAYVAAIFVVFRHLAGDSSLSNRLQRAFVAALASLVAASMVVVFLGIPARIPGSLLGAADVLPFIGPVRRLRGAFLTPEMLGEALLVAFLLALSLRSAAHGRGRILWTIMAALLGGAEILTFSHSLAGFAVAAVLFAVVDVSSRVRRRLAWIAAFSVLALVNAASVVDWGTEPNDHGVAPVSVDLAGIRVEGRWSHYFALKQVAWRTFVRHPFSGVGPGRFPVETERAFRQGRLPARYRDKPPQCDPAGRLAETGFLGGLSLFLLWGSWLRGISSRFRAAPAAQRAAGAAVVGLLVNSLNADVMNFRFLWLALAWALPNDDAPSVGGAPPQAEATRAD